MPLSPRQRQYLLDMVYTVLQSDPANFDAVIIAIAEADDAGLQVILRGYLQARRNDIDGRISDTTQRTIPGMIFERDALDAAIAETIVK